jgi:hypothetical protein
MDFYEEIKNSFKDIEYKDFFDICYMNFNGEPEYLLMGYYGTLYEAFCELESYSKHVIKRGTLCWIEDAKTGTFIHGLIRCFEGDDETVTNVVGDVEFMEQQYLRSKCSATTSEQQKGVSDVGIR